MKQIFIVAIILTSVSACISVKQIGKVNMISNRNVDPTLDYEIISTYSGGSKRELRKTRAITIEDAITQTVKKIPGGEFLMNTKIYIVNDKYFAVEGDVWGVGTNIAYRGFMVGDKVVWKVMGVVKEGTVKSLKDDKTCFVETEDGIIVEKKYDQISKAE